MDEDAAPPLEDQHDDCDCMDDDLYDEEECDHSKPDHPQVTITVGDRTADVDELMAPLLTQAWEAGIGTLYSCQGDVVNRGYVLVTDGADLPALIELWGWPPGSFYVEYDDGVYSYGLRPGSATLRFASIEMMEGIRTREQQLSLYPDGPLYDDNEDVFAVLARAIEHWTLPPK